MNKILRYLVVTAVALVAVDFVSHACEPGDDWRDKVRAEKIAFLTSEMDLTPDEAAKFWPLYNQFEKMRDEAFRSSRESFVKLQEAVEGGKKNVSAALDAYIKTYSAAEGIDQQAVEAYKKVISVDKIAKLYIGEEKFRRNQIQRLHKGDR